MGMCTIEEATLNRNVLSKNNHVLLCEISTHILYQYVLIVLWFLFIASITISIAGMYNNLLTDQFYEAGSMENEAILLV